MAISLSTAARDAMNNALAGLVDAGTTAPAATMDIVNTASGNVLATIPLNNPAFSASAAGILAGLGLPLSAVAGLTGTADKLVVRDRDGTMVYEGSVGLAGSGADGIIDDVNIAANDTVQLNSHTITAPA